MVTSQAILTDYSYFPSICRLPFMDCCVPLDLCRFPCCVLKWMCVCVWVSVCLCRLHTLRRPIPSSDCYMWLVVFSSSSFWIRRWSSVERTRKSCWVLKSTSPELFNSTSTSSISSGSLSCFSRAESKSRLHSSTTCLLVETVLEYFRLLPA